MSVESPSCSAKSPWDSDSTISDPCEAVAPIFLLYQEALQGFIRKRVQNLADAEDLTQQVLLKVHRHCEALPRVRNTKAWLYGITRKVVVDFYRERQRETHLPEDTDLTMDPKEENPFQELEPFVLPLLQILPAKYAVPLRLSDLEGLPQQEIATQLGLTLSGTKSRIQRGREKLKSVFLECCEVELDRKGKLLSARLKPTCSVIKSA
ncbi:RNA polymerase sigma factor SigZ [Rufibacter soli]